MKRVILFVVTILLLLAPFQIRDGPFLGQSSLLRCYDQKVYTSISSLQSQGYSLEHILRIYDNLGFVDNSNTHSMRLDIEAAYLDAQGGMYDKRMEVCFN